MFRWKRYWNDLPENLPVDVFPASNGEFIPESPTQDQIAIMRLAEEESERVRRKMGMTRREFVRTAAAYSIGVWAIGQITGGKYGNYALAHNTKTNAACDLQWPGAQLNNLPGEFIFDVQSHHIESDGLWRVTNPGFEVFFAAIWSQAGGITADDPYWLKGDPGQGINTKDGFTLSRGGREIDPIENLSRYHYLKELFLDSSTNMTVLSAVPSSPENQPLPIDYAAQTCDVVRMLAGNVPRTVMHAFVMPNRGSMGTATTTAGQKPVFMQAEFDRMYQVQATYGQHLRGWKTYTAWGDVPYYSGWYLDDEIGLAFCQQVREVGNNTGMPKIIAVHKGFALPAFDQRAASPRDIGPAARQYSDVTFIVYHSGYDNPDRRFSSVREGPYPGDDAVNSADRSVNAFIKSLRENGLDATQRIPPGLSHGNTLNVYAEIGSTWRSVMRDANEAAHLMGKLVKYVGPLRICWGTDSLWFGSPQSEIVAFRALNMTQAAKDLYNLPYGLDGDAWDPTKNALDGGIYLSANPNVAGWPTDGVAHPERTIRNRVLGYNAAEAYGVTPQLQGMIKCDDVQKIRDAYLINPADEKARAPLSMNTINGPRTRRQLFKEIASKPWSP
jgi:hypothetical protein